MKKTILIFYFILSVVYGQYTYDFSINNPDRFCLELNGMNYSSNVTIQGTDGLKSIGNEYSSVTMPAIVTNDSIAYVSLKLKAYGSNKVIRVTLYDAETNQLIVSNIINASNTYNWSNCVKIDTLKGYRKLKYAVFEDSVGLDYFVSNVPIDLSSCSVFDLSIFNYIYGKDGNIYFNYNINTSVDSLEIFLIFSNNNIGKHVVYNTVPNKDYSTRKFYELSFFCVKINNQYSNWIPMNNPPQNALFANYSDGVLKLWYPNSFDGESLTVSNVNGNVVYYNSNISHEIPITLSTGVYICIVGNKRKIWFVARN